MSEERQRILVIEDDKLVREYIARVLESTGYEVVRSEDGLIALGILARESFDLILVDFVMPRMNGFHFVKTLEMKNIAPGVPIVLMSALTDKIRDRFGETSRVREFLDKPFTPEKLVAAVARQITEAIAAASLAPAEQVAADDPWMLVASMRESLQNAIAQRIPNHLQHLSAATGEEDMRYAVALMLEEVFDEAFVAHLAELVQSFRTGPRDS